MVRRKKTNPVAELARFDALKSPFRVPYVNAIRWRLLQQAPEQLRHVRQAWLV